MDEFSPLLVANFLKKVPKMFQFPMSAWKQFLKKFKLTNSFSTIIRDMRLSNIGSFCFFVAAIPLLAQTPDLSIVGIAIGSQIAAAESHLSGYTTRFFPGRISLLVAEKPAQKDSLTIQGFDGKVAVITRTLTLGDSELVALKTYQAQLEKKFGGPPRRGQSDTINWAYDSAGRFLPNPDKIDPKTGRLKPPCASFNYDFREVAPLIPNNLVHAFTMPVTANSDYATDPTCGIIVQAKLDRHNTNHPYESIDYIFIREVDLRPFPPMVLEGAAKQKQLDDQKKKTLDNRTGPPM